MTEMAMTITLSFSKKPLARLFGGGSTTSGDKTINRMGGWSRVQGPVKLFSVL